MNLLLYLAVFCGLLAIVSYQDFKDRVIDWFLPLLLFVNAFLIHYQSLSGFQWTYVLGNTALVFVQLLAIFLYFSIKSGRFSNIVNRQLGLGDILFFIPICFLFSPFHFIIFFVGSLLLILLGLACLRIFKKADYNTIPLAGAMAITLIIWLIISLILDINLYDDYFWLKYVSH